MRIKKLPHVKKPCKDCPFRTDCLEGWIQRIDEILKADSFVCHKNTRLQCAGHMLIKGSDNIFVRLAGQMGIELLLTGRELVFATQRDCVDHHIRRKT